MHFNNNQATVHPFACYYREHDTIIPLNFIVISDYLNHTTAAFHAFQKPFITHDTYIQIPRELITWAKEKLSLNVAFVTSAECLNEVEILKPRFEEAVAVTSIRLYHVAIIED